MKKDLYIFRHGQSEYNILRKIQGSIDSPLTPFGAEQAKKIPIHLKDKNLGIIYSSHLKRAWKTGEVVAKGLGIEIVEEKDLREICGGELEGKTREEASEEYKEKYTIEWSSDDPKYDEMKFEGGESKREFRQRIVNAVSCLSLKSKHNSIGFATHSYVIKQLLVFCGSDDFAKLKNCEIVHFEFDIDKFDENNLSEAFKFIKRIKTNED